MNSEEIYLPVAKSCVPLDDAEAEMVAELSACGKPIRSIAIILQKDVRLFMIDFKTQGTDVFNAYYRGNEIAKADVDTANLENAKKGNVTAAQRQDKIWEQQKLDNLKEELFNSD